MIFNVPWPVHNVTTRQDVTIIPRRQCMGNEDKCRWNLKREIRKTNLICMINAIWRQCLFAIIMSREEKMKSLLRDKLWNSTEVCYNDSLGIIILGIPKKPQSMSWQFSKKEQVSEQQYTYIWLIALIVTMLWFSLRINIRLSNLSNHMEMIS